MDAPQDKADFLETVEARKSAVRQSHSTGC